MASLWVRMLRIYTLRPLGVFKIWYILISHLYIQYYHRKALRIMQEQSFGLNWAWADSDLSCIQCPKECSKPQNYHPFSIREVPLAAPQPGARLFRLLELLPGTPSQKLDCRLAVYSLDEAPEYEAISYTWGSSETPNSLWIDGRPFLITSNAHAALHRLRAPAATRLLWIDSVCIDQAGSVDHSGEPEKPGQLKLMRDIYKKAARVVVWLGTAIDAFEAISLVHDIFSQFSSPNRLATQREQRYWNALFRLLHHPWFSRVWIIQEVVMGSKVIVVYGSLAVEWETFATVFEYVSNPVVLELLSPMERRRVTREFPDDLITLRFMKLMKETKNGAANERLTNLSKGFIGTLSYIPGMDAVQRELQEKFKLIQRNPGLLPGSGDEAYEMFYGAAEILRRFSHFQATEPKDKIFALLSLSAEESRVRVLPSHVPLASDLTSSDYKRGVFEIYVKLAMNLLLADSEVHRTPLHILPLAGIGHDREFNGLPSWAPDWSKPPKPFMLSFDRGDVANYRSSGITCNHWHYNTKSELPPGLRDDMNDELMALFGVTNRRLRIYAHRGQSPYTIVLQGRQVDRLWRTVPVCEPSVFTFDPDFNRENVRERLESWLQWHKETFKLAKSLLIDFPLRYPSLEALQTAYWRTLIGDRIPTARPAPEQYSRRYAEQLQLQERLLAELKDCLDHADTIDQTATGAARYDDLVESILDAQANPFAIAERQAAARRGFFVTEGGSMALVPPRSKPGDRVCVLLGAQTPFVLRLCDGNAGDGRDERLTEEEWEEKWEEWYKDMYMGDISGSRRVEIVGDEIFEVVGESYVYEMMDGEGIADASLASDFPGRAGGLGTSNMWGMRQFVVR